MGKFLHPWLSRLLSALVITPPLYLVVLLYVRAATTGMPEGLWSAAAKDLGRLYLDATLPALVLLLVLMPLDWLLQRLDFGLTTIVISPLVAGLIVFGLGDVSNEPHVQKAAAALPLFIGYGLVWGLTIRDPATWRARSASAWGEKRAR